MKLCIGTLGRLNDLIKKKDLKLQNIRFLIMDEADKLLNQNESMK